MTFELASNDGSRLWIGDTLVVLNDGLHDYRPVRCALALAPGWPPLTVGWFNETGGADLSPAMLRADGTRVAVMPDLLRAP